MSETPPQAASRLFLDANILISAVAFEGLEADLVALAVQGRFRALISAYAMAQVERVLTVKLELPAADVHAALKALPVTLVDAPGKALLEKAHSVLRDPADAPVLAAAWHADADALVTGDKDFFAAKDVGIRLLRTREAIAFVELGQ